MQRSFLNCFRWTHKKRTKWLIKWAWLTKPPWLYQSCFAWRGLHPPKLGWQTTPASVFKWLSLLFWAAFFFQTHLQTYQPPSTPPCSPLQTFFHLLCSQVCNAIAAAPATQEDCHHIKVASSRLHRINSIATCQKLHHISSIANSSPSSQDSVPPLLEYFRFQFFILVAHL